MPATLQAAAPWTLCSALPHGLRGIRGRKCCQVDFMANPKERISKQMPRCLEQALDICSETWTSVNTQLLLCDWTLPEMGA